MKWAAHEGTGKALCHVRRGGGGGACTERGEGRQQKYHFQTYLLEGYFFMASLFFCRVYQEKNMNRPQKSNGRPTKEQERHSAT